jgi:hypothetical protein
MTEGTGKVSDSARASEQKTAAVKIAVRITIEKNLLSFKIITNPILSQLRTTNEINSLCSQLRQQLLSPELKYIKLSKN